MSLFCYGNNNNIKPFNNFFVFKYNIFLQIVQIFVNTCSYRKWLNNWNCQNSAMFSSIYSI